MKNTILITGANGGIGNMILNYLLTKGHRNIVAQYRSSSDNIQKAFQAHDLNFENHSYQTDLIDEESVKKMGTALREKHGFIGTVVNVAGASKNAMSWKMSKKDFMSVVEDNLLSAFLCSKEFVPEMREKQYGRIINFSSIVGSTGVAGASAYCAAKAGLMGLTKSMSRELASKNITVNAIALGYFNAGLIGDVADDMKTEIKKTIPMQRFGEETDIGSLVQYIVSEESRYFTGQVVNLNGGQF